MISTTRIRLLIADDHAAVRRGLSQLFARENDIEVVGEASDGGEAVRIAAEQNPDVVLIEVSMRDMSGAEATRHMRTMSPQSRVVILTSSGDRDSVLEAIDSGAVGYIFKDDGCEELVRAVRSAARGESPLSARAARVVLASRLEEGLRPVDGPAAAGAAAGRGWDDRQTDRVALGDH
jgi:DNA-binding NarL/FixJ family response regulator